MTDRELMQQALEALDDVDAVPYERVHAIVEALRERLAQKNEPSAELVAAQIGRGMDELWEECSSKCVVQKRVRSFLHGEEPK